MCLSRPWLQKYREHQYGRQQQQQQQQPPGPRSHIRANHVEQQATVATTPSSNPAPFPTLIKRQHAEWKRDRQRVEPISFLSPCNCRPDQLMAVDNNSIITTTCRDSHKNTRATKCGGLSTCQSLVDCPDRVLFMIGLTSSVLLTAAPHDHHPHQDQRKKNH